MSNQTVGTIYADIIKRVIDASRNDYEENGVDASTLEEMQQGWQDKLSSLKIAHFPWDPAPEPPKQPPTVPSNAVKQEADPGTTRQPTQQHDASVNFQNVPIKTENRQYEQPMSSFPQGPAGFNPDMAAARAQHLIQSRTGNANVPMQHQAQNGMPMHMQQMQQQQQQRMQMSGQAQQRPPQQMQRPPNVYASQTDGADEALADWKAIVAARRAAENDEGLNGTAAADNLMRAQVDAMAYRLDSGLMMPLDEMPKGKKRKAAVHVLQAQQAESSSATTSALPRIAPFDGELGAEDEGEDEKIKDEDAINSDLDDSEDDLDGDGDENDDMVDTMLCTYDKVQRVKNKWKCTLKDGILTTNKKEYLFHKATGEFEW